MSKDNRVVIAEVMQDLRRDDLPPALAVYRDEAGRYHVEERGVCTQPNHNAEGVIRYLAHILQNFNWKGYFDVKG